MSITSTVVKIQGQADVSLPLSLSAQDVINQMTSQDLSGMNSSVAEEGSVRTITFTKRTGTKGSEVSTTVLKIEGYADVTLPMALTIEGARDQYKAVDLSAFNATVVEEGAVRTLSFTKRVGTRQVFWLPPPL